MGHLSSTSILIVDDDVLACSFLRSLLNDAGYYRCLEVKGFLVKPYKAKKLKSILDKLTQTTHLS